jgi:hypothetical protein
VLYQAREFLVNQVSRVIADSSRILRLKSDALAITPARLLLVVLLVVEGLCLLDRHMDFSLSQRQKLNKYNEL